MDLSNNYPLRTMIYVNLLNPCVEKEPLLYVVKYQSVTKNNGCLFVIGRNNNLFYPK